ncbi:MAG TPA: polysaccharide biosynthesis protein [Limnochordia bacterium]|nr:polysaccharide biosynthesis protein [Limnochordia bacterium]
MTKESFLRGAAVLALASAVNRLIGLVYMIALPRLISDQGMGLYQLAKPIHYFAAVVAIGGIPVAVAKLIAEKAALGSAQEVRRVFSTGLFLVLLTGGLVGLGLSLGAPWLAVVLAKDPGVAPTLVALGPACFFLALSAGFRGFFQGFQYMSPTALSQVLDQVVRVAATVFLSLYLRPRGLEAAVLGVASAFIVGELTGWLVLLGAYLTKGQKLLAELKERRAVQPESTVQLARRLLTLAFPAVVATILWPVMQLADSLLIPARLQAGGWGPEAVREGLGHLGMALTLAQFPNIVTVALATSLVPAISEAWALRQERLVRYRAEEALRIALIFGIPSCAALYALAGPLGHVLFGYREVGDPLRILAVGTITLGVIQATTGILQGLGAMTVPVRNLGAGVLLKFILNYVLVASPRFGVMGAAWSTTLSWALVAVLNFYSVLRHVGRVLDWRRAVLLPSVAAGGTGAFMYLLQDTLAYFLPAAAATLASLIFGLTVYFLLLMIWGSLTKRDVALLPGIGSSLGARLQEWGFLRR